MGRMSALSGPRVSLILTLGIIAAVFVTEQPASGQRSPAPRRVERVNGRDAAPREVLVRLRPGAAAGALAGVLDIDTDELVGAGMRRMRSRRHSAAELLARLNGRADVLYAEPNYLLHIAGLPNDPYLTSQWAFRDPVVGPGIDAAGAWNISTGSKRFVVGVIDTGVDYTHPDLRANIWLRRPRSRSRSAEPPSRAPRARTASMRSP